MGFLGKANIHATVTEDTQLLHLFAAVECEGIIIKDAMIQERGKGTWYDANRPCLKMGKSPKNVFAAFVKRAVTADCAAKLYGVFLPLECGLSKPPGRIVALRFYVMLCLFPQPATVCLIKYLGDDLLVVKGHRQ